MQRCRPGVGAGLLALALIVPACGGGGDDAGAVDETTTVGVLYAPGGLGDEGINDATLLAVSRAEDDLGVEVESVEPDPTGSDVAAKLEQLVSAGSDVIVVIGASSGDAVGAAADAYPERRFVLVDGTLAAPGNVTSLDLQSEQAAYLAGVAAAYIVPTHHLGFVSGRDDPDARALQAGFTAGALSVADDARVDVAYVPLTVDGAIDVNQLRDVALGQYRAGVGVVLGAQREAAPAVLAAAQQHGLGVRAVTADVDPTTLDAPSNAVLLAALQADASDAVFEALSAFTRGQLAPGVRKLGLDGGYVSISSPTGMLAAEVQTELDDLEAKLASSEIQVPTSP